MFKTFYLSPIGLLEIRGNNNGITLITFAANVDNVIENPPCLQNCVNQLNEFFIGKRKNFNIDIDVQGSDFQKKVWNETLKIPYGKSKTYFDIAVKLNKREAVRAVGNALSRNPIAIVIPCHRIIGSKGNLTGYSGGLWRKKWLLNFENKDVQGELFN